MSGATNDTGHQEGLSAGSAGRVIHPVDSEIAVQFDTVSFSYDRVPVLEKISFHIHCGEFVALTGPNGTGKTTILKLLLGLEKPQTGKIELFGKSCASRRFADIAGRLGYVPQQPPSDQHFPILVQDVVRMGLLRPSGAYAAADKAAIETAMMQAGIEHLAASPYRTLSGGQRRRVLVARALAAQPRLLVLDEPTAHMDSESEGKLFETLGSLKQQPQLSLRSQHSLQPQHSLRTTILIVTHDTGFVSSLTDRVLCISYDSDNRQSIVQHRTEALETGKHSCEAAGHTVRVLHEENVPADDCYE